MDGEQGLDAGVSVKMVIEVYPPSGRTVEVRGLGMSLVLSVRGLHVDSPLNWT